MRPIWGDVDSEGGDWLYLTVWADNELKFWVLDLSDLSAPEPWIQEALGACTIGELFTTWAAYPHTPTFNADVVYIHGRHNRAGTGIAHVIQYTLDLVTPAAGVPVVVENGFGTDLVGALRAEGTIDAARTLYAVRNSAGDVPRFYRDTEALTYISNLPFQSGAFVPVDALTVNTAEGKVAAGSDTADTTMIVQSSDDGATWVDYTGSFPVTGSVRSLTYV